MLEFFRPAVLTMLLSQLVYKMLCTTWLPSSSFLSGMMACFVLDDAHQLAPMEGSPSKKKQRLLQQKAAELARQGAGKVALGPIDRRTLDKIPFTSSFDSMLRMTAMQAIMLVTALSVFAFVAVPCGSVAAATLLGAMATSIYALLQAQLLAAHVPKSEKAFMAAAGFLGMVIAGVLLALLPPWAVAFDANKATAELNASLNGMYAQRAASLEAMRATFAAGGNSTAALFAALMGTGSNATAAAAAAGASTAAGGAAALPSALTAALPPWSLIGLVSAVAGLITSVLLPAAMRYARLAHFALNPPSWARKYMFTLPGATRLLLGVAFALPGVVAFLWASPLATVTGLPPAAVVWLRPALLLFLAALLGILHTPLLQAHLNGGIAAWYTSRFDGADHPNKNKVIKARVEYVNVLASKVAVQIMGSAVLLGSLGAALALATLRHNWDHLSAQGLLLAAVPPQLVNCTVGFLGAWACACWCAFSYTMAYLLRSGLVA